MAPPEVFVSYAQADRDTATGAVAHLEGEGLPCWIAPRDVRPGAEWAEQIIDAIAAVRAVVLVFSASTNASPQVLREVERAVHRRVPVLPFRIEDVLPARSLEYFLSSQHWLDAFPPPMEPHYARLSAYVKMLLTAGAGGAHAPLPPPAEGRIAAADAPPSAATLQHLEAELARYVGPIARHLVNRSARRTTDVEALILELGAEIESEADRRQFLRASRQSLPGRS